MPLTSIHTLNQPALKEALTRCCGSGKWVDKMCSIFPVADENTLFEEAERIWFECNESDWLEAFTHHPEIGDIHSLRDKFSSTIAWAETEQAGVNQSSQQIIEALAEGNKLYKNKFGYIFIVCATGKSAEEMLSLLNKRLPNDPEKEIHIAMKEQNKITLLRLKKLLLS